MPRIEIELDEKGEFVGTLPAEIDAIFKRAETTSYGTGFRNGQGKATEEAKVQIEAAIKHERAKLDAQAPLEKERVGRLEQENQTLSARVADLRRESDRTLKSREETHAREIVERTEKIQQRDTRIQALTKKEIRTEALQAGARDESLDELELIIGNYLGFDDDMLPFVKGADGSPQTSAGKPVALGTFVRQYLDAHPHHRKVSSARGGDARRGATFSQITSQAAGSLDAARARVESGDRSTHAINELFEAARKRAS